MRRDGDLTHGNVTKKGGFTDTFIDGCKLTQISPETELAISTNETVPPAIGKSEVCS